MASVNKVILVGHLGKDPIIRHMPNGKAVANTSLATTDRYTDKSTGEIKENTEWHHIIFFERLAEIVDRYLKKGALIYIEGKLQTRKWTDKNGLDRYTTEIIANHMQMLDKKNESASYSSNQSTLPNNPVDHSTPPQAYKSSHRSAPPAQTPHLANIENDIPF